MSPHSHLLASVDPDCGPPGMSGFPVAYSGSPPHINIYAHAICFLSGLPLGRSSLIHTTRPPAQTGFLADVKHCNGPPAM